MLQKYALVVCMMTTWLLCSQGQTIVLQSQEWDYSHEQSFQVSNFSDVYQKADITPPSVEPVALAHEWDFSGEHQIVSTGGGFSSLQYESLYSDSLSSILRSNGSFESMLAVDYEAAWDVEQIAIGDEGRTNFDSITQGRIQFSVPEASRFVLSVTMNGENLAIANSSQLAVEAKIDVYNESEIRSIEIYFPSYGGGESGFEGGESISTKEFSLNPGDYIADISLAIFAVGQGEAFVLLDGNCDIAVTLFGRSLSAPDLPVGLSVTSGKQDVLLFSASNLEIGKTYGLQSSPDLNFGRPNTVANFERKILFPVEEVFIGSMGPQQFCRLVELED